MNECWTKSADPSRDRKHFGLAVYCARRFGGRGIPVEELIGEAEAALLWAAARFRPEEGARFASYAIPFVLGALRDLCRRNLPMHVPRRELRILCAVDSLRQELRGRNGREPTVDELGQKTGVAPERLASMLDARERMRAAVVQPDLADQLCQDSADFENRILWKDALRSLGKPYGQVLWLRFFADLTQAEIAEKYKVSQGQISRWEKAGREKLRGVLFF